MEITKNNNKLIFTQKYANMNLCMIDFNLKELSEIESDEILNFLVKTFSGKLFAFYTNAFSVIYLNKLFDLMHTDLWMMDSLCIQYGRLKIHINTKNFSQSINLIGPVSYRMNLSIVNNSKFGPITGKITSRFSLKQFDLADQKYISSLNLCSLSVSFDYKHEFWGEIIQSARNLKILSLTIKNEPPPELFLSIEKSPVSKLHLAINHPKKLFDMISRNKNIGSLRLSIEDPECEELENMLEKCALKKFHLNRCVNFGKKLLSGLRKNQTIVDFQMGNTYKDKKFSQEDLDEMKKIIIEKNFGHIILPAIFKFSKEQSKELVKKGNVIFTNLMNLEITVFHRLKNKFVEKSTLDQKGHFLYRKFYFACRLAGTIQNYVGPWGRGCGYLVIENILEYFGIDEKVPGRWRTQLLMYSIELGMDIANRGEKLPTWVEYIDRVSALWHAPKIEYF